MGLVLFACQSKHPKPLCRYLTMTELSRRRYPSPLRYPGGKGKIANFFKLLFLHNDIVGYHYAEPYAGGASVALSLLYEEFAEHIYINDLNRSVFAFWHAVLHDTEDLCRRIAGTSVSMEEWQRQRAVQEADAPDLLDLAFSTFFLNRTNRSGIIGGGVIGGKEQGGNWKIDARYNQVELIGRIEKVARYKSRITLTRIDAASYIKEQLPGLPLKTVVYLDPPYYIKGEGLYEHFYQHQDHEQIAILVQEVRQPWIVSYDAAPEILVLYDGFEKIQYGLSYSAADRYRGEEVMFFSPKILTPELESPANIYASVIDQERRHSLERVGRLH